MKNLTIKVVCTCGEEGTEKIDTIRYERENYNYFA
jgi:hypothetical protein